MISSVYMNLIGALLAIILLVTVITMVPDLIEDNVADDQTVNKLIDALQEADKLGGESVVTVDVTDGGAVFVMDETGFKYEHDQLNADNAGSYTHIKGFYMQRPLSCGDDTCVCECQGVTFQDMSPEEFNATFSILPDITMPDAEMMCEEPTCAEANVSLAPEIIPFRSLGEPATYNRAGGSQSALQHWNQGFILPNFNEIDPAARSDGKLITVAGYAGKLPRSRYTVTLSKARQGITVSNINTGQASRQASG